MRAARRVQMDGCGKARNFHLRCRPWLSVLRIVQFFARLRSEFILRLIKVAWSPHEDFDFDGHFFKLKGIRAKPKPYGGTRPLIMNAGASPTGQAFAIRNCDALFSTISRGISFEETARHVSGVRALAQQAGRELDVHTVGVVTCPPTAREAQDYYRHAVVDNADWTAVDETLAMKNITPQMHSARRGPGP